MSEAALHKRIAELEARCEQLWKRVNEWDLENTNRVFALLDALDRINNRFKDLDKIEQIAYCAYEATHADVRQDMLAVNRTLEDASSRIYFRHKKELQKPPKDSSG